MRRPAHRVVFQPQSYQGMQRGINQMANVIRPTLGPLPRSVAIAHPLAHRTPELLDNGAVIARRLLQLPDRDEDMGAMFLRHVLWHVHERTGDGTATAAVILQTVYNQGIRYIAAGGNPMKLRRYLEDGTRIILGELNKLVTRISGEKQLVQVAETICHDPPLAALIGEIFAIIGEYGRLEIEATHQRDLDREYVEGLYWESQILSREMITLPQAMRGEVEEAAILMTNQAITDPQQLVPALETAAKAGFKSLAVIATQLSNEAMALLLANNKSDKFHTLAAKTPGIGHTKQTEALQDMALLAGGTIFSNVAGQTDLRDLTAKDLGRARKVWANLKHVGLVAGKGDPRALRRHIAELRRAYHRAYGQEDRQGLYERLGKLISGSATLKIGGATTAETRARKKVAEQTCEAVRGALIDGVLPGGGMALLACVPALQARLAEADEADERSAYRILIAALTEPMRTIISNAGYDPSLVMADINHADADRAAANGSASRHGFDVNTGQVVNMTEAGLYDSASVIKTAVQSAIASAALALTTEVLVHHKKPLAPAMEGPGSR